MTTLILFCPGSNIPLYQDLKGRSSMLLSLKDRFSLIFMAKIPPCTKRENWTLCVSMLRFILSLQISFLKLDLLFSMFLLSVTEYEKWFTHAQRQYWCQSSSVQNHVTLIIFQIFWKEGWSHNVKVSAELLPVSRSVMGKFKTNIYTSVIFICLWGSVKLGCFEVWAKYNMFNSLWG